MDNVVPWTRGVDRNIFRPELRNKKDELVNLLYVGRISKEKNLLDFCKLDFPNSKKIIVGDGPYVQVHEQGHGPQNKRGIHADEHGRNHPANR